MLYNQVKFKTLGGHDTIVSLTPPLVPLDMHEKTVISLYSYLMVGLYIETTLQLFSLHGSY